MQHRWALGPLPDPRAPVIYTGYPPRHVTALHPVHAAPTHSTVTVTYTEDLMMSMKQGTEMDAVPIPWTMRPSTHIHRVLQKIYTIWFITLIT